MGKEKQFKDATQGYIYVDEALVKNLIDTYEMQRLKDVAQTGIRPIFSGATHDRFSHSLGVFNIGKRAIDGFINNVEYVLKQNEKDINDQERGKIYEALEKYKKHYWIACILHDIGHPALSHTFEYLYQADDINLQPEELEGEEKAGIRINSDEVKRIKGIILNKNKLDDSALKERLSRELLNYYKKDISPVEIAEDSIGGAPHEMMGALQILVSPVVIKAIEDAWIALDESEDLTSLDRGLIAAMIIGADYIQKSGTENEWDASLRNCVVKLLNGVIDADSIDYLHRNSHFAGYSSSQLDLVRLANAFSASYSTKDKRFSFCLEKSALSVIDGFVDARDFEPKWLYSHHKIVYCEKFLYQFIYKKSCRLLFAQDQARWEDIIAEDLEEECKEIGDSALNISKEQIEATRETRAQGWNDEWKVFTGKLDERLNNSMKTILDFKELEKLKRRKIGDLGDLFSKDLQYKNIPGEKKNILQCYLKIVSASIGLISVCRLRSLSSKLLEVSLKKIDDSKSDGEFIEAMKLVIDILEKIIVSNEILREIKNAYLGYVIAPMQRFVRGQDGEQIYYKTTDSDIAVLYKNMYLKYKDRKYQDLSTAEKTVGVEDEFELYKEALREHHTRNYRKSLWKSEEEYNLFLSGIENKTGLDSKSINRIFLNDIIKKGRSIDWEDKKAMLENRNDKAEAFINPSVRDAKAKSLEPFASIFKEFGEGLVICIVGQKYKNFGGLSLHFGHNAFTGKENDGMVGFDRIFMRKQYESHEFPYLYYDETKVSKSKDNLIRELQNNLCHYLEERLSR